MSLRRRIESSRNWPWADEGEAQHLSLELGRRKDRWQKDHAQNQRSLAQRCAKPSFGASKARFNALLTGPRRKIRPTKRLQARRI